MGIFKYLEKGRKAAKIGTFTCYRIYGIFRTIIEYHSSHVMFDGFVGGTFSTNMEQVNYNKGRKTYVQSTEYRTYYYDIMLYT